jgi:hypothetical protein
MALIKLIDPTTFEVQQYSSGDETTIPGFPVSPSFSGTGGRVESLIYDLNGNLLEYNPNAEYSAVQNGAEGDPNIADSLIIYPQKDVERLGFSIGSYNVVYNILNNELFSSYQNPFRIKEISADRKEVRLTTAFLSEPELRLAVETFFPEIPITGYYPDFYLNFGNGNLAIANNILFDNTNGQYSVLIKLYQPLPSYVQVDSDFNPWIVTLQRDTVAYNVEFEQEIILPISDSIPIKGPNYSLGLNNQVHTSVKLSSFDDLNAVTIDRLSSSREQLEYFLDEKGVEVNIDYSSFENFVHFSSAEQRVKNFFYKVGLLEQYSASLAISHSVDSTAVSESRAAIENQRESLIRNFDGFEYWMYYTSESSGANIFPRPFPKTTSSPPYTLTSTGSTKAVTWLEDGVSTSLLYDNENKDNLINTIPVYLLEDPSNEPYRKFIEMTGQHFDTLFTYAQDITNRYNADNRLDFGISKDLVGEAIKSMGINLYTGNFNANDLYSSFIGIGESGSFLPPLVSGQQKSTITNYVTASNDPTPIEDVNSQIFKRIYHNLPLLLKQKGSIAGLRTLITCFGIPKEVLDVKEFDIDYRFTTQSAPAIGETGSISFDTDDIILPPSRNGYIPNTLLSPSVRVQQSYVKSESYDRSLQYTEVGYSPQGYIDEYDLPSFVPLGSDFPDFNDFYLGSNRNYYSNKFIDDGVNPTITQTVTWDFSSYIRYVKFFDSSLFNMIKDFIPARTSTATGVIIKPTIKERQRQRPAQLTYQNLTYSGSADTLYYDWNGEKYIYKAIGDYDARLKTGSFEWAGWTGGGWNNSNQIQFASGSLVDWSGRDLATPVEGLVQFWTETVYTQMGYAQQYLQTGSKVIANATHSVTHNSQDEFYNGIFKQTGQSNILQPNGYLDREYDSGSGTGLIKTDNNNQNIYKKPSDTVFENLSKGNYENLLDIITTATEDVIFFAITSPVIYLRYGDGSTYPTLDVLQANGSSLNFRLTDGSSYSIAVGTPSTATIGGNTYAVFGVLNGLNGIGAGTPNSYQEWFDASTVNYLAPFDPAELDVQPGPWAYNEFNPLINNSFDPQAGLVNYNGIRKSVIFMDADYSPSASSSINPINTELLKTNSASLAPVQDSYYASRWWNSSRYLGKQGTSPDFNKRIIKVALDPASLLTSATLGGFDSSTIKPTPDLPQEGGGSK